MNEQVEVNEQAEVPVNRGPEPIFCRIVAAKPSQNEKAPKYRILVSLQGQFENLVTDFPVFQNKKGEYSVSMPGGGFPAIAPATDITEINGRIFSSVNPDGADKSVKLLDRLTDAFLSYRRSNGKESDHYITLE